MSIKQTSALEAFAQQSLSAAAKASDGPEYVDVTLTVGERKVYVFGRLESGRVSLRVNTSKRQHERFVTRVTGGELTGDEDEGTDEAPAPKKRTAKRDAQASKLAAETRVWDALNAERKRNGLDVLPSDCAERAELVKAYVVVQAASKRKSA